MKNSYNFMTIRLWATEKADGSGKLEVSVEPEMNPGFGEEGSALLRYGKACTQAIAVAATSRSDEDRILNRAEIRALCKKLDERKLSGQIRPAKTENATVFEWKP